MQVAKEEAEYIKIVGPLQLLNNSLWAHHERSLYHKLKFPVSATSLHEQGFDDWIRIAKGTYDFNDINFQHYKDRYEGFVQGYLCYYEENVISALEKQVKDYILYFDWGAKTSNGNYDVIVYLKSLEKPLLEYRDYTKNHKVNMSYQTSIAHTYQAPPPSMTDPVKPPPPPPPTQR